MENLMTETTSKFDLLYNYITENVSGSAQAVLTTRTIEKLTGGKKNPQQGRIVKQTSESIVTIYNGSNQNGYAEAVKQRMEEEGKDPSTFELKPRAWGERFGNTPFILHKDNTYLECVFNVPGVVTYFFDGEPIAKDKIEGLNISKPKDEPDASQGGIENKVVLRTFSIDSIVSVKIGDKVLNFTGE
jgi:hypothetical protein